MKLSLSARIAEKLNRQERGSLGFFEFVKLASSTGYKGICMRASLLNIDTPRAILVRYKNAIDTANLEVSMVTGDVETPKNDHRGPRALRNITPHLDLAEALGSRLVRVCMKKSEDIPWAQKACDEARERNISLVHQCHPASLFETVEGIITVVRSVSRSNFGLIYEPSCLHICRQDYGRSSIFPLAPYIFNVYLQNFRISSDGGTKIETWVRGPVSIDCLPLQSLGDISFPEVLDCLREIEYQGFVTVHQAFGGLLTPELAAEQSYQYVEKLLRNHLP